MGGARALIASLGASVSLVAGAALSLLFVSFLFAYDGLSGGAGEPTTPAALRVDSRPGLTPRSVAENSRDVAPVVIRTTPRAQPARDAVVRAQAPRAVRAATAGVETRPAPARSDVPPLGAVGTGSATSNPGGSPPATGDGVRDLGDSVSATVGAVGSATAPLGPPVSQAVQEVLNIVQELLKGVTDGLAGTLDTALPRR